MKSTLWMMLAFIWLAGCTNRHNEWFQERNFLIHETFYDNNQLWKKESYKVLSKDTILFGHCIEYYRNGGVKIDESYESGKLNGSAKYYDDEDRLGKITEYKLGTMDGNSISFYPNGDTFSIYKYRMGKPYDDAYEYHRNRRIKTFKWYDNDGVRVIKIDYNKQGKYISDTGSPFIRAIGLKSGNLGVELSPVPNYQEEFHYAIEKKGKPYQSFTIGLTKTDTTYWAVFDHKFVSGYKYYAKVYLKDSTAIVREFKTELEK
ncbi:MAG TPA: hypothetical protein VN721_06690 [Flavipsychrobacter sp.]|nr:hypothetical protein [Flavipsychrobacter sp.]